MKDKTMILTEQFIRIANKWKTIDTRPLKVTDDFYVTPSEIHFIDVVWKAESICVTEAAKILGVTKGAISQMLATLTGKEILRKDSDGENKKTVLLRLTEKGKIAAGFHSRLHESINAELTAIFSEFAQETVEKASNMLERVETFIDAMTVEIKD